MHHSDTRSVPDIILEERQNESDEDEEDEDDFAKAFSQKSAQDRAERLSRLIFGHSNYTTVREAEHLTESLRGFTE